MQRSIIAVFVRCFPHRHRTHFGSINSVWNGQTVKWQSMPKTILDFQLKIILNTHVQYFQVHSFQLYKPTQLPFRSTQSIYKDTLVQCLIRPSNVVASSNRDKIVVMLYFFVQHFARLNAELAKTFSLYEKTGLGPNYAIMTRNC
jgi:hypothetical protein